MATGRTAHLLALMKQGDDAFNSRDLVAMDAVHHPDMIAHVTGHAETLCGRAAHAAAMEQFFAIFPDVHVENEPYPIQFGQTSKWDGDQLVEISAFWDSALQTRQIGLASQPETSA